MAILEVEFKFVVDRYGKIAFYLQKSTNDSFFLSEILNTISHVCPELTIQEFDTDYMIQDQDDPKTLAAITSFLESVYLAKISFE